MISIGLDLATTTGIAIVRDSEHQAQISTENVFTIDGSKYKDPIDRGTYISEQVILSVIGAEAQYPLDTMVIFMEGYAFARVANLEPIIAIGTLTRFMLREKNFKYTVVAPNSLKQFVSGKGQSKKSVMMMNVFKNWGVETKDDNEADAVGLAMFGLAYYNKLKMPASNMEAIKKVKKVK